MSRMDAGNVEEGRVVTEARDATSSSRNNAGDAMLEEAERSALLLLRRELAASRQATERERLVAKRACEQLAEERSAAAEREEELMKMETRLEALMEGTREASHRDASPSHHEEADEVTRRISASSPPAAAKLFKTPHTAGEHDDDEDDDEDDDDDDDDHDANVDPRAVAAAEALLARADALEHEHAHEIASLNARIRALERALSASEGAARVAEAAANEVVAQSASAMERDADAVRRHQDLELEARDLARRLDRETTRSNAWKTRALNAEAKMEETRKAAQRAARDAEMESIAARERSLAEARSSGTFEEKVARASMSGSSSASSGDGGGRSVGVFSRKMSTGRVAVSSPSVAEVGEKVQKVHPSGKLTPGTTKAKAPSARLMTSLASPMAPSSLRPSMDHGGSSPLNAGSKTERDALRASLSRQNDCLARLSVARETRRAEMSLLRDTIHALGALEAAS